MKRLYLVEVHEDDFDYDCFVSGVVWANDARDARELILDHKEGPKQRLTKPLRARLARATGVVHTHWHAG